MASQTFLHGDSDLRRRVELFLQQKGIASLKSVEVDVRGGRVTLQGRVRSFYERQLCLCCQHVAGVLAVIDDLQVDLAPRNNVSPAA
jgi:osmotically-inducible protein OsmY